MIKDFKRDIIWDGVFLKTAAYFNYKIRRGFLQHQNGLLENAKIK